jgi:25S rRNA (uracil2843-N3)-methyltransferase
MKETPKKKGNKARNRQRVEAASPNVEKHTLLPLIPLELQQQLLNVFKNSFTSSDSLENVRGRIQEVKQHLYNRDFARAFGDERYLKVYALRWSASRALSYLNVFHEVLGWVRPSGMVNPNAMQQTVPFGTNPAFDGVGTTPKAPQANHDLQVKSADVEKATRVVCIGGGGGAEIVALAGLARYRIDQTIHAALRYHHEAQAATATNPRHMSIVVLDTADWTKVISELEMAICSPPPLSKYASEAVRAANNALLPAQAVDITFKKQDVLNPTGDDLNLIFQGADLVTIMFTLNELFSGSIAKTTTLLLSLTEALWSGALLLIVDSPGSYSTIGLGSGAELEEKKYPMKWLLDHTLLELAPRETSEKQTKEPKWEKLVEDDARWFRLDEQLQYPVDLENMRYQFHLFRRL